MNDNPNSGQSSNLPTSCRRSQESLQDVVKLIMTLSLGVLALSGTFASQMSIGISLGIFLLYFSWLFLILTIFYGIGMLSSLAQLIMNDSPNWWGQTINKARRSWRCFQVGIVLLVVYGGLFAGLKAFGIIETKNDEVQKIQIANENIEIVIKDKESGTEKVISQDNK
ncbi:MAG TPA: hypothetical protein ENN90_11015 [Mariniphaga anaerophila]|uniref:Uncharacterized protein n=1 Tax=Mariniphaga anaerophila TaxID=1484053 RepID=A0A831PJT7_9BACT|nr:hypothetical protein [Mariniphaga anaerophila]